MELCLLSDFLLVDGRKLNMKIKRLIILLITVLCVYVINGRVWAYRGSAAGRCSAFISKNFNIDRNNLEKIKKEIETVNKKLGPDGCQYDYTEHNFVFIFCRKHGSGSNIRILDSLSFKSYSKDRFNPGSSYLFGLGLLGIVIAVIRSVLKNLKKIFKKSS